MPISKGLFNNTLTLQTLTETDDGQGGVTTSWTNVGSFRARISPLTNQERLIQNKVTDVCTHHVYCDNMTVTTADRIKWGTIYFTIVGIINPSEAYDHLEIQVQEIL